MTRINKQHHTILYVNPSVSVFGAETRLLDLLEKLDKELYTPVVLLPFNGPLEDKLKTLNIKTIILNFKFKNTWQNCKVFFKLTRQFIRVAKENNIDCIHFNLPFFIANFWLALLLLHRPFIVHIRGEVWTRFFERLVISFSSRIIFVSNGVKKNFFTKRRINAFVKFKPSQINVIYDGINLNQFKVVPSSVLRKEWGYSSVDVVFALIGAIDRVKGQDIYIRAVQKVCHEYPQAKFLIVGGLYEEKESKREYLSLLQTMIREFNMSKKILMMDFCKDVSQLLNNIDVLVMPSLSEGLGTIGVEAMAVKRPVIATKVGGLPEVVGDDEAGILLDRPDADLLAKAMQYMMEHPEERIAKGERGRYRAEQLFDFNKTTREIEAIYSEILR